ncbi:MAG TPA: hypothetical protein DCS63_05440 [Elusimicrobia bacterium]|nr:hypothetical protein [Elusimicrobiota bacterium]
MTKSKTFWAAAAFISLAAMAFSGYSIYERVSLHFSGDTIEVRPVPLPPAPAAETAAQAPEAAAPEETNPAVTTKGAQAAEQAETEKIKAVKTAFSYKDPKAKSVKIAGSFTSWKDVKLTKKNGAWETVIYILPGTYPYHFTVDGKKKLDPGKPKAPTGDSLVDVN